MHLINNRKQNAPTNALHATIPSYTSRHKEIVPRGLVSIVRRNDIVSEVC
jgi:hypothetical protein